MLSKSLCSSVLAILPLILPAEQLLATPNTQRSTRPNILVIYADDMSYKHYAAFGGKVLTPHLDRLAAEGAQLSRYYATSAVCSPSRYSVLTGRYASRCEDLKRQYRDRSEPVFIRWNTYLLGRERTLAHLMRDAGYVTALVGKTHNLENGPYQDPMPEGVDPTSEAEARRMEKNYRRLQKAIRRAMGFDEVINVYANNFHTLDLHPSLHVHNPEWIVAGALEFMETQKDRPLFIYVALSLPHGPPPNESLRADPRIAVRGYLEEAPQVQPSRDSVFERVSEAGFPERVAHLTWLDDSVGALLDGLKERGLDENTLVIFASDHSGAGKLSCYDDGTRTPAVVRWKARIPPGQQIHELAANVDVVPTVLDACDVAVPKDYPMDGVSLLPMLMGQTNKVRDSVLLEIAYTKGVVTKDWKYIASRFPSSIRQRITPDNRTEFNQEGEQQTWDAIAGMVSVRYGVDKRHPGYFDDDQLYHLAKDPGEKRNLAYEAKHRHALETMRLLLRAYQNGLPHAFGEF